MKKRGKGIKGGNISQVCFPVYEYLPCLGKGWGWGRGRGKGRENGRKMKGKRVGYPTLVQDFFVMQHISVNHLVSGYFGFNLLSL